MGSMRLLNELGDVTLVWDETADDQIKEVVQRLMDQGVSFFIVEIQAGGLLPPKKTPLEKMKDLKGTRAIAVSDDDFGKLVAAGVHAIANADTPQGAVATVGRAKTAEDVAKKDTMAVAPRRGG